MPKLQGNPPYQEVKNFIWVIIMTCSQQNSFACAICHWNDPMMEQKFLLVILIAKINLYYQGKEPFWNKLKSFKYHSPTSIFLRQNIHTWNTYIYRWHEFYWWKKETENTFYQYQTCPLDFLSAFKIDLFLGKWLLLGEVVEVNFLSSLGDTKLFIFLTF